MNLRQTRNLLTLALMVVGAGCGDDANTTPDAPPSIDAATPDAPPVAPTVSLSTAGTLGAHLVDKDGRTLYFFVNDVPNSGMSTFTGAAWPPFDVQSPVVGAGLTASDFGRFDRGGGVFQATWKGRPLYYYATDTGQTTAGEGIGGRWFVARAYNLFFGANTDAAATIKPQGGAAANSPLLTNGAGRVLYVYGLDTPGTATTPPVSKFCMTGDCVNVWPFWEKPAALTDVVVPSTITPSDLTSFTSQGGKLQFAYKGWPLYFFGADNVPGARFAGEGKPNWYAVAPAWDGTIVP